MIPFQTKTVNDTNNPIDCVAIFDTPDFLKNNLNNKKMYCSSLYLSNSYLPVFIPQISNQQWITNSLANMPPPGAGYENYVFQNQFTPSSLQYYVAVQYPTKGITAIYFINQIQMGDYPPPQFPYTNQKDATQDKYFWYQNFDIFLKLVEYALNVCVTQVNNIAAIITPIPQYAMITTDLTTCNLYMESTMALNCNVYFSDELIKILKFPSYVDTTYNFGNIIQKSEYITTMGSNNFTLNTCQFSDNIYPIESVIFTTTNLPVIYKSYNTNITIQNTQYNRCFLEFYPQDTNNLATLYTPYQYAVKMPVPYLYFNFVF